MASFVSRVKLIAFMSFFLALLSGCTNFGVAPGVVLRSPAKNISILFIDTSSAGALSGNMWRDLSPDLAKLAPDIFAQYGVKAEVVMLKNELSMRPKTELINAHFLVISDTHKWSGSSGTNYQFNLTLYDSSNTKIWTSTAFFSGTATLFGDNIKIGENFLNNIAKQLKNKGLFDISGSAQTIPIRDQLSGDSLVAFNEYKKSKFPRAFVLANDGHFIWMSGKKSSESNPSERALQKCTLLEYTNCHIISVNDEVY